jgi:hypothetical protein
MRPDKKATLHSANTWYTCSLNSTHPGRQVLASCKTEIPEWPLPFG